MVYSVLVLVLVCSVLSVHSEAVAFGKRQGMSRLIKRSLRAKRSRSKAAGGCINVDHAGKQGGQNTCFQQDEIGMVCGWDGNPTEAYCIKDTGGVLVCARAKGGGKCKGGRKHG